MSTTKGFGSDERVGATQRFQTIQPIGSKKAAMDMLPKALFPVSIIPINAEVNPDPSTEKRVMISTGHSFREGDVVRWMTGNNSAVESTVDKIIDANSVMLAGSLEFAPIITDTYLPMRHITLTLDSSGSLVTSSGPIQFVQDAVTTMVEEDTVVPANNKALPSALFVHKDGVQYPVNKDTVTPSQTLAIPVEIVGADGTVINITAGDINVQTSHVGPNADSMRIGDGTNEMGVNASLEALVHDADSLVELQALVAKDFATETTLAAVLAKIIAAPATEAKQDDSITALDALLTELQLKADLTETQPVSAASLPLPTGAATEATLASVLAKIITAPATEAKQDTAITALGDILAKIIAAPATEAKQDDIITALGDLSTAQARAIIDVVKTTSILANNIPSSASLPLEILPATSGIIKEIQTIEDVGEYIELYTGAAAAEVLLCTLPIAGGKVDVTIPAGTRLSIKHAKNSVIATDTYFAANLIG